VKRVAHVLWHSRGGMRRHVRTLAAHPPDGWETLGVFGPPPLAEYFRDTTFRPITRLATLRAGGDADVIHAHGVNAGAAAILPGRPPVVLTLHVVIGGSGVTATRRVAAVLARLVARRADAVIAVSGVAAAAVRRARIIPPAFDELPSPSTPREDVRRKLGADGEIVVAAVSRLEVGKRLDLVIRAVEASGSIGWIVGDGPDRVRLEHAAHGTPVRLLGYRDDVPDILAAADVFAFPSASESYGIAVAEAVRAGLPVVATRTGAIPELVQDAGIIVDVADERGFIDGVKRLVSDVSERNSC
jgi:glycosyltransferase involved in cell wall biosynthesis